MDAQKIEDNWPGEFSMVIMRRNKDWGATRKLKKEEEKKKRKKKNSTLCN